MGDFLEPLLVAVDHPAHIEVCLGVDPAGPPVELRASCKAAASDDGSSSSTITPTFGVSSSRIAPRPIAATGVPHASASATTRPKGSSHAGVTTATSARRRAAASVGRRDVTDVADAAAEVRLDLLGEVAPVVDRPDQAQRDAGMAGGGDGEIGRLLRHQATDPHRTLAARSGSPAVEVDAIGQHPIDGQRADATIGRSPRRRWRGPRSAGRAAPRPSARTAGSAACR